MSTQNDETMQVFVEESLEHLADIENDLLAIEKAGADMDEELVNKVFRAAHSIKGGAGFMGLGNIKELAHKMENVLGMVRSRELIPNPENINILLMASDALRKLIENVNTSNDTDISNYVEGLTSITQDGLVQEQDEPASGMIDISFPDGDFVLSVREGNISNVREEGKCVYLVRIDPANDKYLKGKNAQDILNKMGKSGTILETVAQGAVSGSPEATGPGDEIPVVVLFACVLEPEDIDALLEIDKKYIFELAEDLTVTAISEPAGFEKDGPEATEPAMPQPGPQPEPMELQTPPDIDDGAEEKPVDLKKDQVVSKTTAPETSLRVKVGLLDSLMNLAGELVLSRNQLVQAISYGDQHATEVVAQKVDLITSELQEAVMFTRMQPIRKVFDKFPRVVRDLAGNLNKNVELTLEGKEVELDKTIIEAINDPLTHLVRNSVDHGIESPDERAKANKDVKGKIILKAYHKGGQVNIEITDDGRGLDPEKLAAAALAKGLINENQARIMPAKEKVNLILLPGFSMAEKVTDVSGRGVGMDVLKTNLDKLGGQIDIDSRPGKGTTIRIKLPLTLAVIPSQIIITEGERYAIPQVNLEELLRIPADEVKDRIERVGDAEVVRLRGKLLPLIRLADVIGIEPTYFHPAEKISASDRRKDIADRRSRKSPFFEENPVEGMQELTQIPEGESDEPEVINTDPFKHDTGNHRQGLDRRYHASSAINIVVVSSGAMRYGLVVDRLLDSEEIVIKPLGRHLKDCKEYAGATIMGNGRVALILDVVNLAGTAGLASVEGSDRAAEVAREAGEADARAREDKLSLLVFRGNEDEQFAVPISQVVRIEKIKTSDIEDVGGRRVIQYRGRSLPLFAVHETAQVKPLPLKEDLLAIVFVIADREIGLLATGPVDGLEVSTEVDDVTLKQPGITGSVFIGKQTTLLVDIHDLIHTLNPEWFPEREVVMSPDGKAAVILVVEDSMFFRNQVKGFMDDEGYNVIEAEDGEIAWDLLQRHTGEISLVVTDLEMPNLDGFDLTKKIRADERYLHLPVIALTTLAGEEEIMQGKQVGIDDYQIKLDKQKLMESVSNFLRNGRVVSD
ncbi:MAG: chemotaxis protein CheW [Thermodesulfobacteriota bacterium]|nr:chemotaxis protein CheW [Thermodesulfobacteriota bacterium]